MDHDNDQLYVEDETVSKQHDSDGLRTHITETQFSQLQELEVEELTGLHSDELVESQPNDLGCHELEDQALDQAGRRPSPQPLVRPPPHQPRYIFRADIPTAEPESFAFSRAPKATVDYSRKIGQRNTKISAPESLTQNPTNGGKQCSILEDVKSSQQKVTEKAVCRTPAKQRNILPDLPLRSMPGAGTQTRLPRQDSHNSSHGQPERPVANTNDIRERLVNPSSQNIEQQVSDVLPLYRSTLQRPLTQQTPVSGSYLNSHGATLGKTDKQKEVLIRGTCHPAVRPSSPHTALIHEISHHQSKVTKTRRKPKPSKASLSGPPIRANRTDDSPIPSKEDLLTVLLFRTQQEKRARDIEKAHQQAREAEHHRTEEAFALLRSQMEQVSQREKAKGAELARYAKALPGLKDKAKKLEDYLKGLTNDYHKLRDDSVMIHRQQESLQDDKTDIFTSIREAREAIARRPSVTTEVLADARHRLDILEQRNEAQASQAEKDAELLQAEQDRNQRLEQELSKVNTSQGQMVELLQSQRAELMEKLSETLINSAPVNSLSNDDQRHMKDMLAHCFALLKEVKETQNPRPEDLEKLDESVKGYAQYLNIALQHVSKVSDSTRAEQRKLKHHFQKQIDMLKASIKTEQNLSEQVVDLREIRATVKERLQASETALAESRHTVIGLQRKEEQLNQEIMILKGEVLALRAQPSEDADVVTRLREIESLNLDLETEAARMLGDASEHANQAKSFDERAVIMQNQIEELTSQLEATKLQSRRLEKEKSSCEELANKKYESLKSQLLEATNAERAILTNDQSIVLEKLHRQKALAESKAKASAEEAGRLKAEKDIEVQKCTQLQLDLQVLQIHEELVSRDLVDAQGKLRTSDEDYLEEIQSLEEDNLNFDRLLAEADARVKQTYSEVKSQADRQLDRIHAACQAGNMPIQAQIDLDSAIDLLVDLVKCGQRPHTPMLDDVGSQELHHPRIITKPAKPNKPANVGNSVSQQLQSKPSKAERPSWARRSSLRPTTTAQASNMHDGWHDTNDQAARESRQDIVIQESQTEETTIRRNHKTTKSTRTHDLPRALTGTPTRQRVLTNENHGESSTSTPRYSTDLFGPPTPLQSTQAANPESQVTVAGPVVTKKKRTAEDFGFTPREEARKKACYQDRPLLEPMIPASQTPSRHSNGQPKGKRRGISRSTSTSGLKMMDPVSANRQAGDKFTRRFSEFRG